MRRIILYIIVLMIALWIPVSRIDISDLEPIQAVWINKDNGNYVITTDTEDVGIGETVRQAVENMKYQSEKIIYLDTAQFLLVEDNCREAINEISEYLKGRAKVCVWNGEGELAKAARYMKTHRVGIKLKEYFTDVKLTVIPG